MRKNQLLKKICNLLLATTVILFTASCSKTNLTEEPVAPAGQNKLKASPVGDVVGKVVVGYQGWFDCAGSGSPKNTWVHWAGSLPAPGNQTFELWPDTREYTTTYATGYANLGNGSPAKLFSSYTDQTINKHFEWMQLYGIDCAAFQRFGSSTTPGSVAKTQSDAIANKVKNAAQTYGRKFYIMYDCSATTDAETDWTSTILPLTASSAYAKQNGKPVVCLYGVGNTNRGAAADWLNKINWFKNQGCYVIISTIKGWRTDATYASAYAAAHMISPWSVGTYKGVSGADGYVATLVADRDLCNSRGQDYMPIVFPGFAWSNWKDNPQNDFPRVHGDFLWRQFYNIRNNGIPSAYVAMFDEYDEATAIAKAAEDASMKPTNQYFLTLDADGVGVSSDFYLRLTGDGARMVKSQIGLMSNHPTPHMPILDNCDASSAWTSANTLSVNTADKQQGTGCLQSVGSGTDEFRKVFSTPYNSGATQVSGFLQFWYYVSDVSKFSSSNQVELGSAGRSDMNEYNWNIGTLVNGWNLVTLKLSSAGTTGGTPNLNAINWFRIYHAKTASITTRVDGIRIIVQ